MAVEEVEELSLHWKFEVMKLKVPHFFQPPTLKTYFYVNNPWVDARFETYTCSYLPNYTPVITYLFETLAK